MLQLKASLPLILGGSCLDWDLFIMRKYSFFKVNESFKIGLIILEPLGAGTPYKIEHFPMTHS